MDELQSHFERTVESLLAVDCGSVWTRVVLLDRVDGQYHFIARGDVPTSIEPPTSNVAVAVRDAIRRIEANTGRVLLDSSQELITPEHSDSSGVDLCVLTCSAAAPLKVAVAGLVEQFSTASARRAARATYGRVTNSFALDAAGGRWGSEQGLLGVIEQLYQTRPDVVLLSGGTDGGAVDPLVELAQAVAVAAEALSENDRPTVLFAGNDSAQPTVAANLGEGVEMLSAPNVLPATAVEQVEGAANQLDAIFRTRRLSRIPGYGQLQRWSSTPMLPTVESIARVIQFLARRHNKRVLGIDIGASNTSVVAAFGEEALHTLIRTDLGVGYGLEGLLTQVSDLDLFGWIPGDRAIEEMRDELTNIMLRPVVRPQMLESLWLLQAAAREALRLTLQDARPAWPTTPPHAPYPELMPFFDYIVAGGGPFRAAPRSAQAVQMLLDAVQPIGVVHLMRDRVGLLPTIGAAANGAPEVAADLISSGTVLESMGTVVAPVGRANPGEEILNFRVIQADGGSYEMSVNFGEIERIALPVGQALQLELHPTRNFDIGLGPGKSAISVVSGGTVGLIVDARGRPLVRPDDLSARREQARAWKLYIGG